MALSDWQWEFQSLTFGAGTDYELTSVEGFFGSPDVKLDDVTRPDADGSWVYGAYLMDRYITFSGDIRGDDVDDFMDNYLALAAIFEPTGTTLYALTAQFPGGLGAASIDCMPVRFAVPVEPLFSIGLGSWIGQLVAPDPTIAFT
jgi:hypothetical protein